jgi:Transposase DDE domain group 1
MGEKQNQPFQLSFNASLKVDFQGSRVTSDGGLILIRELDERLGLEKLIEEQLSDSRQGLNKQFTLADLLRQSVYSRLAGYEDLNDAERLAADPTFRLISSQRIWDRGAALTSTLHWFETELLTKEENLIGLMALNRESPHVAAWAKNDHLGFEITYSFKGVIRKFRPDYLVRLANGKTLVLEVKGQDNQEQQTKREFLEEWVRAVNGHGGFGTWAAAVSRYPSEIHDILQRHGA